MKKYCLLLLFITLTLYGCGELKDPYANLKPGGSGSGGGTGGGDNTPTSGTDTIPVSSPNNGADAIAMAMPSAKTQADYERPETFFVKISESKTSSSYQTPDVEDGEEYLPFQTNTYATPDFHTSLRIKEKELLRNLPSDYFINQAKYRSLKATTPPPALGSKRTFSVNKTISGVSSVEAEYVGESAHAYLYIPSALKEQLTGNIDKYKTGFDKSYNTITKKFGPESDIDSNGKVIILFFNMALEPNVIGYFFGGDQILEYPESNKADIFYMNTLFLSKPDTILATLSHEFQHMTYFYNMISKASYEPSNFEGDSWMNEGLSMLSSDLCGDAGTGSTNYEWIGNFLSSAHRKLSLTNWSSGNYGYSAIFNYYIYQSLGGDVAIKKIYASNYGGIKAVEEAGGKDFNEIFTDFVDAVYNNKITRINDYGFTNSGRTGLSYSATLQRGNTASFDIPAYSFALIKVGYPISSLTFSHNGNITGKAYPLN